MFYISILMTIYMIIGLVLSGYRGILNFNLLRESLDTSSLIFINFIFDVITLWLIYKILQILYKNIAFVGCILFLLNPNSLISSSQIMTESISQHFILSFYLFDEKI